MKPDLGGAFIRQFPPDVAEIAAGVESVVAVKTTLMVKRRGTNYSQGKR